MDKGTLSNIISTVVLVVAFALPASLGAVREGLVTAALFAVSGGITNALAVKMLFDRIPGLIGSGVIPARFRQIRREIKRLIMEHFFSESYLKEFLHAHARDVDWRRYVNFPPGQGPVESFVERSWERLASPQAIEPLVDSQIERILDSSVGGFLHLVGRDTVRELVGNFVLGFASDMKSRVLEASSRFELDADAIEVELNEEHVVQDLREQADRLLEKKLEQLDADQVKRMMEDVIRNHLGWLVVWGNVFGAAIGVAAYFLRAGS